METTLSKTYMSDKAAKRLTWIITTIVFAAVTVLGSGKLRPSVVPALVYAFPRAIAIINGTTAVILICSFLSIKAKKISLHRFFNYSAMILSAIFLVLYITTHLFIPDTRFGGTGPVKGIYLFLLATHIMLAAAVLPMVLLSFHYGRTGNVARHRRLTRYSFPMWLYVTITGVVVYLMIQPYYNFPS